MNINLNDGDVHSFDEIKQVGLQETAKQFSEGNKILEEILLSLWDMGFETRACCKGTHEQDHRHDFDGFTKHPYISLNVTFETKDKILKLIEYIYATKGKGKPNISFDRTDMIFKNGRTGLQTRDNFSVLTLDNTVLKNDSCNDMFKFVLNAIKNMQAEKEIKQDKKLEPALNVINDLVDREITDVFIQKISINILKTKKCFFSFGRATKINHKHKLNNKTVAEIKSKYQNFTVPKKSKRKVKKSINSHNSTNTKNQNIKPEMTLEDISREVEEMTQFDI